MVKNSCFVGLELSSESVKAVTGFLLNDAVCVLDMVEENCNGLERGSIKNVDALVNSIPTAIIGGVSFILYGMISAVGVRNVVENHIDFTKSRNVIIAALIMVLSIGVNYSAAGAIAFIATKKKKEEDEE